MRSDEKLGFLIKTFKSNNSKLAKAINVDPSLVSKWRNGKRVISKDSPYIEAISDYFLGVDLLQEEKDILINMLKRFNPHINMCSRAQMKRYMTEWFFSTDDDSGKTDMQQYVSNHQIFDVNDILIKFNHITSTPPGTNDSAKFEKINIPTAKGEAGHYEAFRGKEGKRQCALHLINSMLASDRPLELLLYDESNMDWLVEDRKFLTDFGEIMRQLILRGHKIVIIHNVNRELSSIMAIMDFWLPLHLTGCVESYFSAKSLSGTTNKTLCIARGSSAIVSINSLNSADDSYIFLTKDEILVKLTEDLFMSYLAKCRSLIKVYRSINIDEFYNELMNMEEKLGSVYTLRNKLTSLAIPFETYSKLLDALPLTETGKRERLRFHIRRVKNFKERIKYYRFVEIINIDMFETYNFEGLFKFEGLDFLTTEAVKCSPEDFIAYMTNLISFLKEYANYEVILVKLNSTISQNRVSINVKTDSTAIVSSCDTNDSNPVIMITDQDHIVEGLKHYLLNLIDSLPATRTKKESVIEKLKENVAVLKEWSATGLVGTTRKEKQ